MCGICFICGYSISPQELDQLIEADWDLLKQRGPDAERKEYVTLNEKVCGVGVGCVLWLQGKVPQHQPLFDDQGNVLLWNGDILAGYQIPDGMSDTKYISRQLANISEEEAIMSFLSGIKGPWSFIYFRQDIKRLYFGRDVFGRHSLLWQLPSASEPMFMLSSVCHQKSGISEVPAYGIYYVDFSVTDLIEGFVIHLIPWSTIDTDSLIALPSFISVEDEKIESCIRTALNMSLPSESDIRYLRSLPNTLENTSFDSLYQTMKSDVDKVIEVLRTSIKRRVNMCPRKCRDCTASEEDCHHSRIAVLFSGGLDSAMIALLLDFCLPEDESIDLLNVAFAQRAPHTTMVKKKHKLEEQKDVTATPVSFEVPDRLSGRQCWQELLALKPNRRWNFVEIDVSREEVCEARESTVKHLIHPLASVLDDSIGCALWFASRGRGTTLGAPYVSPARVVLCGVGADEQLGGYARHRGRFQAGGWPALLQEIHAEMTRIHSRNLGRDNRILSHHGRAPRLPYLDEDVVSVLNQVPVWVKANLYLGRGIGEKLVLRLAAAHLRLPSAAVLPKRAIQFGSRIAKMENHKEKGSDECARLVQGDAVNIT